MPDYLTFVLHGPMASFGDIAVGEHRPTATHPSKSAVLGLLAAALGRRREEETFHLDLARALGFAVRVDSPGVLVRDYHTSQVPAGRAPHLRTRRDELAEPKLKTILSVRDYLCDACFTCCLWESHAAPGPVSLADIAAALRRPLFSLFLGRKACPLAFPLQPQIHPAPSLAAALTAGLAQYPAGLLRDERCQVYFDPHELPSEEVGLNAVHSVQRRDRVESRLRWQFTERMECLAFVSLPRGGGHGFRGSGHEM